MKLKKLLGTVTMLLMAAAILVVPTASALSCDAGTDNSCAEVNEEVSIEETGGDGGESGSTGDGGEGGDAEGSVS